MEQVILVRYGEVMLKGLNRRSFEERLAANIRRALMPFGQAHVRIEQGRIFVEPRCRGYDARAAAAKAATVFGVVSASAAYKTGKSREDIKACAEAAVREHISARMPDAPDGRYAFKVETKRADKAYGRLSPEVSRDTGTDLLGRLPELVVDVNHPQFIVYVEIRDAFAYVCIEKIPGFGGLPLGTNGKALLLLSGGIDSPVAGFMMAKRGVEIEAVHFYSYPYTSERSKEKVLQLCGILAGYFGKLKLHIVPFTDVQLAVRDSCREEYMTIVTRRAMMLIADIAAKKASAQALVTGESMGQVASQTILSLAATDCAPSIPVFRPLIGMDKNEVIEYARRIGTFETSILPYDDCCTLFAPKHPRTKPRIADVLAEEARIANLAELVKDAADRAELVAK